MLALAYGMRRGEVLGLHWSALDWQAGTVRVTHGVKRVKDQAMGHRGAGHGWWSVKEPKTPKSRRTLTLTPELVARFRQHRLRQAEAQIAAGVLWQDHGLMVASDMAGRPMRPNNFSHSFARLCVRAWGLATGTRTSCAIWAPRAAATGRPPPAPFGGSRDRGAVLVLGFGRLVVPDERAAQHAGWPGVT